MCARALYLAWFEEVAGESPVPVYIISIIVAKEGFAICLEVTFLLMELI